MADVRPGRRLHVHADRVAQVGRPASDDRYRGGNRGQCHHHPGERVDAARRLPRSVDRSLPGQPAAGAVPVQALEVNGEREWDGGNHAIIYGTFLGASHDIYNMYIYRMG